jgi:biopolymer transport protein ExbD
MAEKRRLLDVWIVDLKQVYREVPFAVVTDWLQQGRLLPDDRVRLTGAANWHEVGKVPAFAPFLPKEEPFRAEDQAEALEPVEMDLEWRNRAEEEDEDVDMIPLIDVSLVLLIFFMLSAVAGAGFLSFIDTPGAQHQLGEISQDMYWVGVDTKGPGGKIDKGPDGRQLPWYLLGLENQQLVEPRRDLGVVSTKLAEQLAKTEGDVKIRIRADHRFPIETIQDVTLELQGLERRINRQREKEKGPGPLRIHVTGEVSEPKK